MGCQGSRAYTPPNEVKEDQPETPTQFAIASTTKSKGKKKVKYPENAHAFKVRCRNMPPLDSGEATYDPVFFLEVKVDPNTESDQGASGEGSEKKKEPWKLVAKSKHKAPHPTDPREAESQDPEKRKVEKISENIERDLLCYKDRLNDQTELRISAFGYRGGPDIFRKDLLGYVQLTRAQLIARADPTSDFYEAVPFTASHHIGERKRLLETRGAQLVIRALNEAKRQTSPTTKTPKGPKTKTTKGGETATPATEKQAGGQKRKGGQKPPAELKSQNSNSGSRSGSKMNLKGSSSNLVIEDTEPKTNGRVVREGEEAPKKLVKQRSR